MKPLIDHSKYNKITDDIYLLGANAILRMNVTLSYTKDNERISYHREVEYFDQSTNSDIINIRRSFDYYISIENIKSVNGYNKEFIRIGMPEIMLLRNALNNTAKFFTDKKYENLFGYIKETLTITKKVQPIEISNLPMGRYLVFEPTIVTYNDISNPGIRMYLSDSNNFTEMNVSRFMGFVQLINDINILTCAQIMINYLERPEFGTNIYRYNNNHIEPEGVTTVSGRKIPSTIKPKSYFDIIDKD